MATTAPTTHAALLRWVDETAKLTKPDKIVWCDGSEAEKKRFTEEAVAAKVLIPLDQKKWPGCYYHHSSPSDVASILCVGIGRIDWHESWLAVRGALGLCRFRERAVSGSLCGRGKRCDGRAAGAEFVDGRGGASIAQGIDYLVDVRCCAEC